MVTAERIEAALMRLGGKDTGTWAPILAAACAKHGLDTPARAAGLLGNAMVETGGFRALVESMDYTPERLLKVFGERRIGIAAAKRLGRAPGRPADQKGIANAVYGGEWGRRNLGNTEPNDGWEFRGRGLIQLTGRFNYTRFGKTIGATPEDLAALLETPEGAADSAAHFYVAAGCNELADAGQFEKLRRAVNSAGLEMEHFLEHCALAEAVLAEAAPGEAKRPGKS